MIRALIIEDEFNSQEVLKTILEEYCNNITVLGIADSVETGIASIKQLNPSLVFLDVEIKGGTGFDILQAFDNPTFKVIFVTGYDFYAIKALIIIREISVNE